MTIREIIGALQNKGYSVTFRERSDRGVIITKINGQRFSGAKGNLLARSLLGESLSTRRESQLSKITKERTQLGDLYKKYRKVARKWRTSKLPKSAGNITLKKLKRVLKERGLGEAYRVLGEKEKYASGVAYSKNVEALAQYIEETAVRLDEETDSSELYELAEAIRSGDGTIRDEDLLPAYEELYRLNTEALTSALVKDIVRNVKRILKI